MLVTSANTFQWIIGGWIALSLVAGLVVFGLCRASARSDAMYQEAAERRLLQMRRRAEVIAVLERMGDPADQINKRGV